MSGDCGPQEDVHVTCSPHVRATSCSGECVQRVSLQRRLVRSIAVLLFWGSRCGGRGPERGARWRRRDVLRPWRVILRICGPDVRIHLIAIYRYLSPSIAINVGQRREAVGVYKLASYSTGAPHRTTSQYSSSRRNHPSPLPAMRADDHPGSCPPGRPVREPV